MKLEKLSLNNLTLHNFATFSSQVIPFGHGLNAIIGETGSGKSLILDAIQLILGSRSDKKLIRKGAEFLSVEATFDVKDQSLHDYFHSIGHPIDSDEITIKRIVYKTGKSKSFLNFTTCPLSTLIEISKKYIDLVGQFENQKLLSPNYQLALLDSYANVTEDLHLYQDQYQTHIKNCKRIDQLLIKKNTLCEKEDYIRYQINEIKKFSPDVDEEVSLIQKKEELIANQTLEIKLAEINSLLSESESSIISQIKKVSSLLCELPAQTNINLTDFNQAKDVLEDLSFQIASIDSERQEEILDEVIDRLDIYQKLKRKHGGTTAGVITSLKSLEGELNEIEIITQSVSILEKQIEDEKKQLLILAKNLHQKRIQYSGQLSRDLTKSVQGLKMAGSHLQFKIEQSSELNNFGISKISFLAELNPGEGYHLVKNIASGGELSRILLSFRKVISNSDSISVFLFDEIDTGIGGETALAIGSALRDVSKNSQVITITHLPQIAHYANEIISVSKESISTDESTRTFSSINVIRDLPALEEAVRSMSPLS